MGKKLKQISDLIKIRKSFECVRTQIVVKNQGKNSKSINQAISDEMEYESEGSDTSGELGGVVFLVTYPYASNPPSPIHAAIKDADDQGKLGSNPDNKNIEPNERNGDAGKGEANNEDPPEPTNDNGKQLPNQGGTDNWYVDLLCFGSNRSILV